MRYDIGLLDKRNLLLHCYILWKVMRYNIGLLDKK